MLQRAHAFLCDSQSFMVPVNTKQIKMIVQTNVRFKSNESLEHPKKYQANQRLSEIFSFGRKKKEFKLSFCRANN